MTPIEFRVSWSKVIRGHTCFTNISCYLKTLQINVEYFNKFLFQLKEDFLTERAEVLNCETLNTSQGNVTFFVFVMIIF